VTQLQGEREQTVARGGTLQQAIKQVETMLGDARTARDGAQRELETRRRERDRAEAALDALERQRTAVQNEHAALRDQQATWARSIDAAETTLVDAQATLDAAQAVLEQRRAALAEAEQHLQPLRTAQATTAADVRATQAEARTTAQTLERLAREHTMLEEQRAQLAREQLALREQIGGAEDAHARAQSITAAASEQITTTEHTLRAAEAQLETLEQQTRQHTAALLDLEAAHGEAALAAQRCQNERDAVWERAAEDNIDVEHIGDTGHGDTEIRRHGDGGEEGRNLEQRIDQLKARLRRMGPVNALAPAEYQAAQERHTFLSEQLADVRAAVASLRTAIGDLNDMMQQRFATTFDAIGHEFERSFKQLFGGGSAKLSLVRDGDGAAVHGVEIVAQPPGKRLLNLQLLSGGERSLTAAALLFAILKVNPSPFCMLDEVDAALDEANVVRFREALLELAERTQFVIITHNRGTVEAANTLYGITMGDDGGSRVLSVQLEEVDADGSLALVT
jgi:chromosome segregation protein